MVAIALMENSAAMSKQCGMASRKSFATVFLIGSKLLHRKHSDKTSTCLRWTEGSESTHTQSIPSREFWERSYTAILLKSHIVHISATSAVFQIYFSLSDYIQNWRYMLHYCLEHFAIYHIIRDGIYIEFLKFCLKKIHRNIFHVAPSRRTVSPANDWTTK